MKRSEIVKIVSEKFEEFATNQQYPGFSNEGLTEVFLNLFLDEGMLPPEAADFNIGNNWEPEAEIETPYGKSVVEQVNAEIKELNRIVDILKENDVI